MSAQTARKLNNSGFQTMHLHHVQNAPGWVHRLKSTDLNRLHCINFGRATDQACGTGGMLSTGYNFIKRYDQFCQNIGGELVRRPLKKRCQIFIRY